MPDLPDVLSPQVNGICSSGSTGTPKVILSGRPGQYEARQGVAFMEAWRPVPRPQTIMVLAPMYHTNGFATLFSLLGGDRLVVLEKFDAARVVDVIEHYGVSTFTATPTMLQRIADLPDIDERDLSGVDWILQGAAPMPPSLVHRWADLIGAERIVMAYGMTEGLGLTALRGDEWMTHQGSVGRGFRETDIRILDADGRRPCRRVRSATSTCAHSSGTATATSAARRRCRPPTTASRRSATSATSMPTATSTSPTDGST